MLALQDGLGQRAAREPAVVFARTRFAEADLKSARFMLEPHDVRSLVCLLSAGAATENERLFKILLEDGGLGHQFLDV